MDYTSLEIIIEWMRVFIKKAKKTKFDEQKAKNKSIKLHQAH
jgi:hypothetical protein